MPELRAHIGTHDIHINSGSNAREFELKRSLTTASAGTVPRSANDRFSPSGEVRSVRWNRLKGSTPTGMCIDVELDASCETSAGSTVGPGMRIDVEVELDANCETSASSLNTPTMQGCAINRLYCPKPSIYLPDCDGDDG